MCNKNIIWELNPHSEGKHKVLKRYLDAWFPIIGSRHARILFIDGFAGPGEYLGGKEGSPLIAIHAYKDHSALKNIHAEVCFLFIEKNKERAEYLEHRIEGIKDDLPPNCRIEIIQGEFDIIMTNWLDDHESQGEKQEPAFIMIDPSGISGIPMRLIQRILINPSTEVYITLMYQWINRFKSTSEFEQHMDLLFGCGNWRQALCIDDPVKRKNYLFKFYEVQLRNAGAKHVIHFELYEGNSLVYAIFFGTKNVIGCERMKQAIWKIAPWGDFKFHGTRSQQLTLGLATPDFEPLKHSIRQRYQGAGWVSIGEIERFVSSDQTDYLKSHLRQGALIPMEAAYEIEVDETTRSRRNKYPPGTMIRFV